MSAHRALCVDSSNKHQGFCWWRVLDLSFHFWRMKPLSQRCLYLISAFQTWAFGVILCQTSYIQIPKRLVWWFNLLVCSTNLHMWSGTRDTFNDLQLSNKLLQLDLKGFSQTSPDIRFPLSACFQGPSREQMASPFPRTRFPIRCFCFVPRKQKKMKLLSSPRCWIQSKLKLYGYLL